MTPEHLQKCEDVARRMEAAAGQVAAYLEQTQAVLAQLSAGGLSVAVRQLLVVNDEGQIVLRLCAGLDGNGLLAVSDKHGITSTTLSGGENGGRVCVADASGEVVGALQGRLGRGEVVLMSPSGSRVIGPKGP